jgi:hypothetical protein
MTVPSRSNAATRPDAVGARWTPCRQLRVGPREGVSHRKGFLSSSSPALRFSKMGKTEEDKKVVRRPFRGSDRGRRTFGYLGTWLGSTLRTVVPWVVSFPLDRRRRAFVLVLGGRHVDIAPNCVRTDAPARGDRKHPRITCSQVKRKAQHAYATTAQVDYKRTLSNSAQLHRSSSKPNTKNQMGEGTPIAYTWCIFKHREEQITQ